MINEEIFLNAWIIGLSIIVFIMVVAVVIILLISWLKQDLRYNLIRLAIMTLIFVGVVLVPYYIGYAYLSWR